MAAVSAPLRSLAVFLLLSLAVSAPTQKPAFSDDDLFDLVDDNEPKAPTKSQTTTTTATTTTIKPPPPKSLDDFDLDIGDSGKKSDTPTKPKDNDVPSRAGGFSDDDLFGGGDAGHKPVTPAKPKPDRNFDGTGGGSISDDDLFDITGGKKPAGGGGGSGGSGGSGGRGGIPSPTTGPDSDAVPGTVAGILGALAAAILAGGSSFVAYQKKKLCFKAPDNGEGHPDGQRGDEPQLMNVICPIVLSALLSQASRFFSGGGTQQQQQPPQQQQPGSPQHDGYTDEEKV